jgi:glycosyltransferase involved in cell wall biosynthesis
MNNIVDIIIPSCKDAKDIYPLTDEINKTRKLDGFIIFTGLKNSASKNRNEGLKRATSNIVIMMDDDITGLTPGWDEILVNDFIKNEDKVFMVTARLLKPDLTPNSMLNSKYQLTDDYERLNKPETCSAAICFRKTDIRFDENYIGSGFEDTDFCRQHQARYPNKGIIISNRCKLIHINEQKNQTSSHYFIPNRDYFCNKWNDNLYRSLKAVDK